MMAPGHGLSQAWLGLRPGALTAGAEVEARLNAALSAYARGEALWDGRWDGRAMAGLRLRW